MFSKCLILVATLFAAWRRSATLEHIEFASALALLAMLTAVFAIAEVMERLSLSPLSCRMLAHHPHLDLHEQCKLAGCGPLFSSLHGLLLLADWTLAQRIMPLLQATAKVGLTVGQH